ncbi:MAG: hypothetical protein Q8T13_17670 [Acidobacteriota bacterium]|nr:hypothetical protein [Acidobacteriota bacterium]
MRTDIATGPIPSARFVLSAMAGSLALFGALRLPWTEAVLLLPLTRAQGVLAERLFGAPSLPVQITLECSGAEVLALCAGAVLAYPVRWRARLAGAAVGIGLILLLNTLRIGTLGLVVASPVWFNRLHLFLWPTLLTLVVAGYVFAWMALADRGARKVSSTRAAFPVLAAVFLIAFAVASPWYLESPGVLALGGVIATAAAALLSGVGMSAYAVSNVLVTSRGAFIVTQECVTTPLIPIYLAAVGAYAVNWRWLVAGVMAAAPLFTALGIARLLVVALPAAVVASPTFLVHAFYQLLLGAVVVVGAAVWRHGRATATPFAATGLAIGGLAMVLLAMAGARLTATIWFTAHDDPQGAIQFLPAFQVGLYLALWAAAFTMVRWTHLVAGLAVLAVTQVAVMFALHALTVAAYTVHVRDIRAWAVVAPVLILAAVAGHARAGR